ncbi:MAG TPA: hypothetical protein VGR78_03255, partial [Verrucomicrobiae bacterium]|nr:hypothetical protein [Verrucomicrobiae bacterium]
ERPQGALVQSLRQLGYRIETSNGKLPAVICGEGARPGESVVSIEESSQFASALLLAGKKGQWQIKVTGENSEESPYVSMTSELIAMFPKSGGLFEIEPDASSASYLWGANWLLRRFPGTEHSEVSVNGWMKHSLQIDARFPDLISRFPTNISRRDELGDSIMTAIVLAPFAEAPKRLTDLGRLRLQECERVRALKHELKKCGGQVEESGDTLTISPGDLHAAEIETYHDHRMAMCFGTLALKVPGIKIQNPACVKKTFPNFFQKLAAPSPDGLGAKITNARTGEPLKIPELHAD